MSSDSGSTLESRSEPPEASPELSRTSLTLGALLQARWLAAAATVIVLSTLLFFNLGHYPLWGDEATNSLIAEGVWRTGDTSVVLGQNVVINFGGKDLDGLLFRSHPPLPYYLEAPFVGLLGHSAFAARLPFVLAGLLALLLVQYWLWKDNARPRTWVLVGFGACGNVALILYTRQARYYALVTLLTLLITFLYLHRDGRRRTLCGLSAASLALFATHYLAYAGLGVCLGVDYLLFGRRRNPFTRQDLLFFIAVQVLAGGVIVSIWNPFGKPFWPYRPTNWIGDKLTLAWWSIRDMNASEFGVGLLLVAAPVLYFLTKRQNLWLVRLPIGIAMYVLAVTIASPQPVGLTDEADIRYLQALIPAFIFLGVTTLEGLPFAPDWPRYVGALILFQTTILQSSMASVADRIAPASVADRIAPERRGVPPRSTLIAFVGELRHPVPSPFGPTAEWINDNVVPDETIFVVPTFATYPLMFHSPHAIYGWQLDQGQRDDYPSLPPIHFQGAQMPDYIVVFGGNIIPARRQLDSLARQGVPYLPRAYLPVHWPDPTRPELIRHSFVPIPVRDQKSDGVFIFQRER